LSRIDAKSAASLIVGLAHQSRFRIAAAIMTGADSHQALAKKVSLKAGPLYHHLRSLERAGVVVCLERSKYALTDRGQVAMLMLAGLCGVGNRKAGWTRFR
jgi:predicted transcriptional regulator